MYSKKLLKTILFFILLFIATNSFAEDRELIPFQINDFSKGLNSYTSPYSVPANQGMIVQNVRIDTDYGALTKRDPLLLYGTASSAQVTGMHRFYQSDSTKQLLLNYSTYLGLGDDTAGTFTQLKTGLTDGAMWQWVTYKNKAIGVNGSDKDIKYDGKTQTTANTDGSRTPLRLVAQLGAPFAEQNTGSNLDASKYYAYQIAFFNSQTAIYSNSTARSNYLLTGSTVRDITLTDIPIGETGTTSRIIYRTEGKDSISALESDLTAENIYKVAEIADNTTTTYDDAIADATILTDPAPTWATASAGTDVTPPIGKYAIIHDQRLFIAGNPTNKSTVYWSEQYYPDVFDTVSDNREIRPDDGDKITGLFTILSKLGVAKQNSIQKIFTDGSNPANDWSISDPFTSIGVVAPYSIASTPRGTMYLNWDGIYLFDGQYSKLVSEVVTDVISDISKVNITNCFGFYNDNKYYLAYTSNESGATENNRVLVYDILKDAYMIDTIEVNYFTAFNSGTDTNILYAGTSGTTGKVWAYSAGTDILMIKTKSDFELGTFDDAKVYNTEDAPRVDIAWGLTIDNWGTVAATIDDFAGNDYIIDRKDTDGSWTSPAYHISASSLNKIYWNEELNTYGDITFQVRTGATASAAQAAAWSSAVSVPTGSDISATSGNEYLQIRANLSTTDQTVSPELYVSNDYAIKVDYLKAGSKDEITMLSEYKTGWLNFGLPDNPKIIQRIQVFYRGTSGMLTVTYTTDNGFVSNSFDIDLSMDVDSDPDDEYEGNGDNKIYTYRLLESETAQGQYFQFDISDTGNVSWTVDRIQVLFKRMSIYE